MSRRSNKRAKKLSADELLQDIVTLDQHNKLSELADDELFVVHDAKKTLLTSNQLRKKELSDLLFNKPAPNPNYIPGRKFPKTKTIIIQNKTKTKQNRALQKLIERENEQIRKQSIFLASKYKNVIYNGDDNQGDITNDKVDFFNMRPALATHSFFSSSLSFDESDSELNDDEFKQMSDDGDDGDDDDNDNTGEITWDYNEFEPEFVKDWIKYTGGLTRPIPALIHSHKVRFAQLKAQDKLNADKIANLPAYSTVVKATPSTIAKSILTGRHIDHVDMDMAENDDIWDTDVTQKNAELNLYKDSKKTVTRTHQNDFDLNDNMDYVIALAKDTMKNRRHKNTQKYVTTSSLRVAPPGLSINPVKEDMNLLLATHKRKVKNEENKTKKLLHVFNGGIKLKQLPNVSAKEKARFAKTIYKPVVTTNPDDTKRKTRQERNAEKKKALNRYKFMIEKREREFAKKMKRLFHDISAMKKKEKFLKEKLPLIRAELAELKKDQPIKIGRNYYKSATNRNDFQTEQTLAASHGHLRRTLMSTSLLNDSFNALQRTNQIPAIGRHGKRPAAPKYKMKDALAGGVRIQNVNVDEIVKKHKEKALANPKTIAPTKNKKRKLEMVRRIGKDVDEHYDYGYDSDDDIWA
jgi:hypothetical protein